MFHGQSVDGPWTFHGRFVGGPWTFHETMDHMRKHTKMLELGQHEEDILGLGSLSALQSRAVRVAQMEGSSPCPSVILSDKAHEPTTACGSPLVALIQKAPYVRVLTPYSPMLDFAWSHPPMLPPEHPTPFHVLSHAAIGYL